MKSNHKIWASIFRLGKTWDGSDKELEMIVSKAEEAGFSLSYTPAEESKLFFTKAMEYLNHVKGGRPFAIIFPSKASSLILNLKKKGFTLDDIKYVIDIKSKSWRGTDSWEYFRWKTLFNETNFLNYIAQDAPTIKRGNENAFSEFARSVRAAQGDLPSGG